MSSADRRTLTAAGAFAFGSVLLADSGRERTSEIRADFEHKELARRLAEMAYDRR